MTWEGHDARLSWILFGAAAALSASGLVLLALSPPQAVEDGDGSFVLSAAFTVIPLAFGLVGALVAARLPANPIGWLFLGIALVNAIYQLADGWAAKGLPGEGFADWVAGWTSPMTPPLIIAALLLFPDGRLPGPRWRWALWALAPVTALVLVQYAFEVKSMTAEPLYTPLFVAGAAALVVRFRRSRGVERLQVKWFAYSATLVAGYLVVASLATGLFGGEDSVAAGFVFAAVFAFVPVAAGIAILRYRLYDIDVVIRRTLVYGALTATLAGAYLGLVLLAGLTVGESDVAVAVSTLLVAALFQPARARIQAIVDRRFYRRRYDASRTLDRFSARLRDELDLDTLGADLRHVVLDTVQPEHVSLWLRRTP